MDPAEIRFIRKFFIKEEAWKFFEKSARHPSCQCLLKIPRHLVQLLAIGKRIAHGAHTSRYVSGLLIYYKQLLATTLGTKQIMNMKFVAL
jgi:hypothetical protein